MLCPKCKKSIPDDAAICCYCGKRIAKVERKTRKRPNGAGSVYHLTGHERRAKPWGAAKGGVYIGSYATRAAAEAALDKFRDRDISDSYNYTLDQIHSLWKAERYDAMTAKGKESYDLAWKLFEKIKNIKMKSIRAEDVQPLIDAQVEKGRSRSQCEKIRGMYSQLCKLAMREEIIDRNYATFLRLPSGSKPQRDVFTDQEIDLIKKDASTSETSKLILILIYTGLRINELLLLPKSGIDLKAQTITGGEKTEAGRDRIVPINKAIKDCVEYFYSRADGDLLISGYSGNKDAHNFRGREYYPTLERLGIRTAERRMNPHCCRYTFATRAVRAGVKPEALQKIMGHAKYDTTTDFYIQDDRVMLEEEMQKIK